MILNPPRFVKALAEVPQFSVARGVVLSRLWATENTFLVCRTALAAAGGTTRLRLLSTAGNSYDSDYFGDSTGLAADIRVQQEFKAGEEWDMPMLNVFYRDGKTIRHFWGSEILYVPPEPGQEYRHNDALDPLWNMLDLSPAGRGNFHPQLSYA